MLEYGILLPFAMQLKKLYSKACRDVCVKYELTQTEFDILDFLGERSGLDTAGEIARQRLIKKANVSTSVERLIRKGLLLGAVIHVVLFAAMVLWNVNVWVFIVMNILGSAAIGMGTLMQWGLVSETVNYNAYLTGMRTEGTIFGVFNMLRRVGQAIGSSLSVASLGALGYDVALANQGLQQSSTTLLGMKVICFLVPAVCILGSWAAFQFLWNITPEVREKMRSAG